MGLKKDNLQPWEWLGTNMEDPILFPSSLNTETVLPYRYVSSMSISETKHIWLKYIRRTNMEQTF